MTQHQFIIFAIDNGTDDLRASNFEQAFNDFDGRKGNLVKCLGYWEGVAEPSYIALREDFENIAKAGGWVDQQICTLAVTSCNKQYAQLEYPCGKLEQLGSMHEVTREEALASVGYTYRPDLNIYWVAKQGNPDNSYRESCARRDAGMYDNVAAIAAE